MLREAAATLEIIEEYPHDKYLPSFLLRGEIPEWDEGGRSKRAEK